MGTSFKSKCLINKKDKDKMETAENFMGNNKKQSFYKALFFCEI